MFIVLFLSGSDLKPNKFFQNVECKFTSATPALFLNVCNGKKFENTLTRLTVTGHKDHITQTFKGVKIEPRISLSVEIS